MKLRVDCMQERALDELGQCDELADGALATILPAKQRLDRCHQVGLAMRFRNDCSLSGPSPPVFCVTNGQNSFALRELFSWCRRCPAEHSDSIVLPFQGSRSMIVTTPGQSEWRGTSRSAVPGYGAMQEVALVSTCENGRQCENLWFRVSMDDNKLRNIPHQDLSREAIAR